MGCKTDFSITVAAKGIITTLFMRLMDPEEYEKHLRTSSEMFDKILGFVGPVISKQDDNRDDVISAKERLALTLR